MPENRHQSAEEANQQEILPCGLLRRLLIMAYDAIAVIALMMLVTALLLFTPLRTQTAFIDPLPTGIMILTWFLYLAWCWRRAGLTLGMRAWRVRLVFENGTKPGWGRCILRFVVSLASAAAFGIGFIWCLFNPRRQSWHDIATNSSMIRTPKPPK